MSVVDLKKRMPFSFVIGDDKLMGKLWKKLSVPQQVVLKALYGLPLDTDAEREAWSMLNDATIYDELFFPTQIGSVPYEPREYSTIVGLIGRRSGKSYISCFAALYEIIFGGHLERVEPGEQVVVPYIAQDLDTAKKNMAMIKVLCDQVPLLKSQIVRSLSSEIEFKNGIKVIAKPPVIETGRGWAIPVVILDEVGFWYKTIDAANPDFEVLRAVSPSQAQFAPFSKQIIISSPYTEEGILWDYSKAGTLGCNLPEDQRRKYLDTLVMRASTAGMQNPRLKDITQFLIKEQAKDEEAFPREYGARFVSAISGMMSRELLDRAIDKGIKERRREDIEKNQLVPFYVAAMDPAFRHDSWAFTIFHRDQFGRIVQDILRVWTPNKKAGIVLNPAEIMAEISQICHEWRISLVYSDQYQLESLQQIGLGLKLAIAGIDFTGRSKAQIFGSFVHMLRQGNVKLLDDARVYQELSQLQKKLGAMGSVQISAPPGKKDDIACATVLGARMALFSLPKFKEIKKEPTLFQEGLECIKRKLLIATREGQWV